MISVLNLSSLPGVRLRGDWLSEADPIYFLVDRQSCLGNPFVIGRDGDRVAVIQKFKQLLWRDLKAHKEGRLMTDNWEGIQRITGLFRIQAAAHAHNVFLVCHCKPDPCHADVIKAAVEWLSVQTDN